MRKNPINISKETLATNLLIGMVSGFIIIMFKNQTVIGLQAEDYLGILLIGVLIGACITIIEVLKR